MKFRRKSMIVGIIVLSLGLVAGCGAYRRHRLHHRDVSKYVLKRWDRHVAKLDLSDVQKEQHQEIRQRVEASLRQAKEDRERFFSDLKSELDRENPDPTRLVVLAKERAKAVPGMIGENLDHFVEFYNILDADQKAQVIEMIRKRMKRRGY